MICFGFLAFLELFGETVYKALDPILSSKGSIKIEIGQIVQEFYVFSLFQNIHFSV